MTESQKWNAVINNSQEADGTFFYAVKSTGIFCRPSCKSKKPARENTVFFDTCESAVASGFRPCKRCRPDLDEYSPQKDIAIKAKHLIEQYFSDKQKLEKEINKLGISKSRLAQIFREEYKMSMNDYSNDIKIKLAKEKLQYTDMPVIDIAFLLGFESLSSFFVFFRKYTGITPKECRQRKYDTVYDSNGLYGIYDTLCGQITIASSGGVITAVQFGKHTEFGAREQKTELTDEAAIQIDEYFSKGRKSFDIPLAINGTEFQKQVLRAIRDIPYGETRTYKEIAQKIGRPSASRAVGMASNKNSILLMIPCHRVIGSNGTLVGYAGGIDMKAKLLRLERNNIGTH